MSLQSTPNQKTSSKEKSGSVRARQSSNFNLLITLNSDDKPPKSNCGGRGMDGHLTGSEKKEDRLNHSDDEIDPRRGLEPDSSRTDNPKDPELLR